MSFRYAVAIGAVLALGLHGASAAAQVPDSVEIHPMNLTALDVAPYSTTAQRFWIKNTGTQTNQYSIFANVCTPYDLYCDWSNTFLGTIAPNDSVPFDVKFTAGHAGTSGTISFDARISTNQAVRAAKNVTVNARQEMHLEVDALNPGAAEERDLCVTVAVATDAAYECGDLRLVHALPSVRARGTVRTPTLLYNSRFAHPFGLVQATLSVLPHDITNVTARLRVPRPSGDIVVSQGFSDALFTASSVQKFALGFDASALPTGVYPYTLTTTFSVAGTPDSLSATGELIVVNRKTSPFGAGWWLAGYERIYPQADSSLLWVGGDGSARHYDSVAVNVFKAPAIDRPDSITVESGNFVRHLRSGAKVEFAPDGKHFATSDRLGLVTFFHHDQYGQMVHIDPAGFGSLRYDFTYSSSTGPLETVTAPSVGGVSRVMQRYVLSDGRILSQTDPDNSVIEFRFDNASIPEQITRRINRRGVIQSFAFDAVGKFTSVRVPLNASDTAVTTFCPAESRGLVSTTCSGGPLHPDSAVTVMDGPRPDVTDVTTFRLDRFGAPKIIRDALGNQTQLLRGNRTFPGLVTRVVYANGWTNDAFHDVKGLLTKLVQHAPLGPDNDAVTEYAWDPKWERVAQITMPEGNIMQFQYDSITGNRIWQQDGRGASARVNFRYYASGTGDRLLRAAEYPNPFSSGDRDSVEYDALGNVQTVRQASGNLIWSARHSTQDDVGRTTSTCTDIDIAGNGGQQCQLRRYDIMDRDSVVTDSGPPMFVNGNLNTPAQSIRVASFYDDEGNLTRLDRLAFNAGVLSIPDTLRTQWEYDDANRRVKEIAGDDKADSLVYDAAGNITRSVSRRTDPSNPAARLAVNMSYDALNRLTQRTVPAVSYPARSGMGIPFIAANNGDSLSISPYPRLRKDSANGLTIDGDVETFSYDVMGAIRTANNGDARVSRTYYSNGLVHAETLKVRNYSDSSFATHVYVTTYEYDLNGRRVAVNYPPGLTTTAGGTFNRARYTYDPGTGALSTVTDVQSNVFTIAYDLQTRADSVMMPGGIVQRFFYDGASRLVNDFVLNRNVTTPDHFPTTDLRATTLGYNSRGDRLLIANGVGSRDTLVASYYGLGYLAASDFSEWTRTINGDSVRSSSSEGFSRDALANDTTARTDIVGASSQGFERTVGRTNTRYQPKTGRHVLVRQLDPNAVELRVDSLLYDESGNVIFSWTTFARPDGVARVREDRASYYGADGRLRVVDHRTATVNVSNPIPITLDFDEHRYDALGRRVLSRTQRACVVKLDLVVCPLSTIRRTVWDGDQELMEIQQPGYTGASDAVLENDTAFAAPMAIYRPGDVALDLNWFYGRVAYTFGPTLDQPVSITRWAFQRDTAGQIAKWLEPFSIVPHWNVRGGPDNGAFANGATRNCNSTVQSACVALQWPFGWTAHEQKFFQPRMWNGSLLEEKRDGSGLVFKRNRYLDPATGKFTQEDPIGLAGGLNLYGFAGGDPVNFSDPFGLQACKPMPQCVFGQYFRGLLDAVGLRNVPLESPRSDSPLVVGFSGTLLTLSGGCTTGAVRGCGGSVSANSPSIGASFDFGVKFRSPKSDAVLNGYSISYGVGKHTGVTVSNETFVINWGASTPTWSPVTVSIPIDRGAEPEVTSMKADLTAVRPRAIRP